MSSGSIPPPRACSRSSLAAYDRSESGCSWRGGPRRVVDVPLDLARALPEGRFARVPVGSLEPAELDLLLAARLDARPSARLLERLHARSGGNPFFALEIARAMIERGSLRETDDEIPIPASLHDLVRERLERLPPPAREATEIVAALSRPTLELVDAVTRQTRAAAVEAAAKAGILELRRWARCCSRIRCSPRSRTRRSRRSGDAACTLAWPRSSTIPRNAGVISRWRRRAPTAAVAAALDEAAMRARARGAPGVGRGPVGAGPPADAGGRRDARRDDGRWRRQSDASTPARSTVPESCWRRWSPKRRPVGSERRR